MDRYIGKLLDNRYEILERIGTGGMAVVYKARCHRLNRLVAIKILKEELAQDEEFRRRFHDESQAVAMLSHPNIMAVYDVSKSGGVDYIVMELLDGITLKQYMQKKGGKLTWKESLHFIIQIMKALSHAHSRGIIHRDIKPHNIMVLRDGSIKVADFGIARLTSSNQNTLTQEALGSVHYISPEQARGSHIDARSDIYSAGVVLYEMMTGRLPYEGDSPVAVAIQHINSIPLSPREMEPDLPEALEAITLKAMASDVNKRYISADAMLVDLEEFRKNPNINFDFAPEDMRLADGEDEPTQIIGANTPSAMTGGGRRGTQRDVTDATQRIPRPKVDSSQAERFESEQNLRTGTRKNPEEFQEERPSPWPIVAAVGAILIFLVGIGYFLYTIFLGPLVQTPEDLEVPDLLGKTLQQAQELQAVKEHGFIIVEGEAVSSDTYGKGTIADQSPKAGETVRDSESSRTITVNLSLGSDTPKMPDLSKQELALAKARLERLDLNLNVTTEEEFNEEIPSGYVTRQEPETDTELTAGQTVTLWISKGPESAPITMISFIGQTYDSAVKQLREWKLEVEKKEIFDDTVQAGYVIAQTIDGGTQVQQGARITLTVSKGPEPAPTPSPTSDTEPTPGVPDTPSIPVTKHVSVPLPDDGREVVQVRVQTADGHILYDQPTETKLKEIKPSFSLTQTTEVSVYIDGVHQFSTKVEV